MRGHDTSPNNIWEVYNTFVAQICRFNVIWQNTCGELFECLAAIRRVPSLERTRGARNSYERNAKKEEEKEK